MARKCPECNVEMVEKYPAGFYPLMLFDNPRGYLVGRMAKHKKVKAYVCPKCDMILLYQEKGS